MQRRMDCQPEVNGFAPTAHYTPAEQTFDGVVVPTQRRISSHRPDRTADRSYTPITLDIRLRVPPVRLGGAGCDSGGGICPRFG